MVIIIFYAVTPLVMNTYIRVELSPNICMRRRTRCSVTTAPRGDSFEKSFILDIRNSYYGYPEKLFQISEINVSFWISIIVILDIRNNNSGYPK